MDDGKILFIDKPSGITSFDVIRQLRRKLGIRKMGHAGTLDPLATGLLIIALEGATKEISKYMNLDKTYEVLIEFGKISDTYDAQGEIKEQKFSMGKIEKSELESMLRKFTGAIQQVPPAFSAIRVKGRRAYDLAREGKEVKLEPRQVMIHSIDVMEFRWPLVRLNIRCSKGTYIRSLAHDLGQALGCGGYVKELRRTAIGPYKVSEASNL